MKRTMLRAIAAALGTAGALSAFAAHAEGQIGFVDVDRVFAESRAGKQAKTDLDNEAAGYKRELDRINETAAGVQQDLDKNGLTLSESDRAQRLRRIGELKADYDRKNRDFNEEWNQHRQEAEADILKKVGQSVAKVAEREHLDLVVSRAVAVAGPSDITAKVIEDLDGSTPDPTAPK